MCEPGYYFDFGGNCIACQTDEHCMYCDPDNPSVCVFCKFGSYMTKEGACTLDTSLISEKQTKK